MRGGGTKGSYSLEFLIMYGFALLVISATLGALWGLDLQRPKEYAPSSCSSQHFSCLDSVAYHAPEGKLILRLSSGVAGNISLLAGDPNQAFSIVPAHLCAQPQIVISTEKMDETPLEHIGQQQVRAGEEIIVSIYCDAFTDAASASISGTLQLSYIPQRKTFVRTGTVRFTNIRIN